MKKVLLWSSCLLLFLSIMACTKESQTILAISAHNWIVSNNSPGGTPGDEYRFYDNRLFMYLQNETLLDDGEWQYDTDGISTYIYVNSDLGYYQYEIMQLTNTELELKQIGSTISTTIKLIPKQ